MTNTVPIPKNQNLPKAQDYLQLRQLALDFLSKTGDADWTDYNLHDPGITFMELLAYGITDLSYRQDLPMTSLLAVDIDGDINGDSQVLYTPAEILTISPLTINDYRLLLINITGIQNAWLTVCTSVSGQCGLPLYADCKAYALSYQPTNYPIVYGGLYNVALQLNSDSGLGDLNSGSVFYHFVLPYLSSDSPFNGQMCGIDLSPSYDGYIEMRFKPAGLVITDPSYAALIAAGTKITGITGLWNIVTGQYNPVMITSNVSQTSTILQGQLQNALSNSLYATLLVHYTKANGVSETLEMDYVPFRIYFSDSSASIVLTITDLISIIEESTAGGILLTYQAKLQAVETTVEQAQYALNEHRNYCEDFCNITLVQTEDFAICCDIDATTDADLVQLQAAIYAAIINYMNPPLKFYSWEDLVSAGYTIDQIFNGPRTNCGFIKPEDLANSGLRTEIYTADIIKLMYAIPGVVGVTNFTISRIGPDGNLSGQPQQWQINVTAGMLPDFYVYASNIRFYKNSFPFQTDFSQILDAIGLIEASWQNPKMTTLELDVPLPTGQLLNLSDYYPLMYSLPPVYNVSPAGPMPPFTQERYSQANQLMAYLLFFEQIYADWIAQIGGLKDFFNTEDPTLKTYLSRFITDADLNGVTNLYTACYNQGNLQGNCESTEEFNDRKNRIYNHLMARLGENNEDYLMISNSLSNSLLQSPADILAEKARLLRKYPDDSYNKARALDYRHHTRFTSSIVHEGLIDKLCDLLGLDSINDFFHWQAVQGSDSGAYQLVGSSFNTTISISFNIYSTIAPNDDPPSILTEGYYDRAIRAIDAMLDPGAGGGPRIDTHDNNYYIMGGISGQGSLFTEICRITTPYNSLPAAWQAYSTLVSDLNHLWISNMILPVEHILLRPMMPNEPTLNTCIPKDCIFCGDEDPYSFRMTIIMCGDVGFPGYDLNFRAYAETLIRTEIPAHLLTKVCWVSEEDCIAFSCYYRNYLELVACNTSQDDNSGCHSGSGSGYPVWAAYGAGFDGWRYGVNNWGSGSGQCGSGSGGGFKGWIGGYNGCWGIEGQGWGSGHFGSGSGSGSGCTAENIAAARALLVNKLNNIRSLYPPARLNDCADNSPAQLVYLGKTVI